MRADSRVVVLGEDVGKFGGVFRATSGLFDEFGADRVIDTPLAEAGISVELIDMRTLMPFDIDTILTSVRKTGRCVIVHEAPKTCGFGAELIASIQERAMESLEAPILRVTGFDTPFPYSLEHEYMPNPDRVMGAIRQTLEW